MSGHSYPLLRVTDINPDIDRQVDHVCPSSPQLTQELNFSTLHTTRSFSPTQQQKSSRYLPVGPGC